MVCLLYMFGVSVLCRDIILQNIYNTTQSFAQLKKILYIHSEVWHKPQDKCASTDDENIM